MKDLSGELYLDTIFPNLKNSEIVNSSVKKSNEKVGKKEDKIRIYLDRLNKVHQKAKKSMNDEFLLNQYIRKYVINLYDAEKELSALKKRNPLIDLTANQVVDSQITSLTRWIKFLSDDEFAYPLWCKYLIFQSVVKIGNYIEANGTYAKRTIKKTLSPFFELNEEAVYKAIKEIMNQVEEAGLNKEKIKKVIDDGSFIDRYIMYYQKYQNKKLFYSSKNDGIWKKYEEGKIKDAKRLHNDIKDKGTGWCTASDESMAISQVCGGYLYDGGDFYVYFTKNSDGEYTIPRIAIRMNGTSEIGEIRGVAESQNMEDGMEDIIYEKLLELGLDFSKLDESLEMIENCKRLSKINKLVSNKKDLSLRDILFIYEIRKEIITFGYSKDPRITKIKKKRNVYEDYKKLVDYQDKKSFLSNNGRFIPDKCIKNKDELDRDMLSICGPRILSDELRDDKKIIFQVIKENPLSLAFASDNLKKDLDLVWFAVNRDASAIEYASETVKSNPKFLLGTMALSVNQKEKFDEEQSKRKYYKDQYKGITPIEIFKLSDEKLQRSKKFILYSIKYSEDLIDELDEKYKSDEDFLIKAISKNEKVIYKVDKEKYKSRSFCKRVLDINGQLISVFDNSLRCDIEMIDLALSNDGLALKYYTDLVLDEKFYLKAVKSNGLSLEFVPTKYRTRDLVYEAVSNNGLALEFTPSKLKHERDLIVKALENNGLAIKYILTNDRKNLELIKIAIKSNPKAIRYIKVETEESVNLVLNLIKDKPSLIREVPNNLIRNRNFVMKSLRSNIEVYEFLPSEYKYDTSISNIYSVMKRIKK